MRKLLFLVLTVIVLLAVLRVGWVLPQRLIGNGVDGYAGPEKPYASNAIDEAKSLMSEGLNPGGILVSAYRVTRVMRCPEYPIRCGPPTLKNGVYYENPACEGKPFAVEVQTYTIFAVPSGKVGVNCGGSVGYGVSP